MPHPDPPSVRGGGARLPPPKGLNQKTPKHVSAYFVCRAIPNHKKPEKREKIYSEYFTRRKLRKVGGGAPPGPPRVKSKNEKTRKPYFCE